MYTEKLDLILGFILQQDSSEVEKKFKSIALKALNSLLDDAFGVNSVLLNIANGIYRIRVYSKNEEDSQYVNQEAIEDNLYLNLRDIIASKKFNKAKALAELDYDFVDQDISYESSIEDRFMQVLRDNLDIIFDREYSLAETQLNLESLKKEVLTCTYETMLKKSSDIYNTKGLQESIKIHHELNEKYKRYMAVNVTIEGDTTANICSYDASVAFDSVTQQDAIPLFKMRLEPYSEYEFNSNDICTIVGRSGIGKTTFVANLTYDALTSAIKKNLKLLVYCTETSTSEFKTMVESVGLFLNHKIKNVPYKELLNIDKIKDKKKLEILQKYRDILELNKRELYDGGGDLIIKRTFNYETAKEDMTADILIYNPDIIVIDHTRALDSTHSPKSNVRLASRKEQLTYLSNCIMELRTEFHLGFIIASHPSSKLTQNTEIDRNFTDTEITADAVDVSQMSSFLFYLQQDNKLLKLQRTACTCTKSRGRKTVLDMAILQREGSTSCLTYNEEIQENFSQVDDIEDVID